jgi:hypothetical protein
MSLMTILIVLLIVAAAGGFWSNTGGRQFGVYGWSPLGVVLVVLLILLLLGYLDGGPHHGGLWLRR